jgi:hypothetical protein
LITTIKLEMMFIGGAVVACALLEGERLVGFGIGRLSHRLDSSVAIGQCWRRCVGTARYVVDVDDIVIAVVVVVVVVGWIVDVNAVVDIAVDGGRRCWRVVVGDFLARQPVVLLRRRNIIRRCRFTNLV